MKPQTFAVERRRSPRFIVRAAGRGATLCNLGMGGATLEGRRVESGTRVSLGLAPHTTVDAMVVWTAGNGSKSRSGLQFDCRPTRENVALAQALASYAGVSALQEDALGRFGETIDRHADMLEQTGDEITATRFGHHLNALQVALSEHEQEAPQTSEPATDARLGILVALSQPALHWAWHRAIVRLGNDIADGAGRVDSAAGIDFRRSAGDAVFRSPFFRRAYEKPLGYAGDYRMMEMLYDGLDHGGSLPDRITNSCLTSIPLGNAVRNRAHYLKGWLERVSAASQSARILSIACGPARELALMSGRRLQRQVTVTLVDQDPSALAAAAHSAAIWPGASRTRLVQQSVRSLVRGDLSGLPEEGQHLIYAAGLFDYLAAGTAKQLAETLYGRLAPGGTLVVGNFVAGGPFNYFIDAAADWRLLYRTAGQLTQFASGIGGASDCWVENEPAGVNAFLCVRRPGGPGVPRRG